MYLSILGIIAALTVAAFGWWLRWPKHKADSLRLTVRDPKARADIEDNIRKTIGQFLGGAAVLIGVGSAYGQFLQQQQASRELFLSNQVSRGFEQLGSDKVVVRLGGIYALQGVMITSEQYYLPVLETLSAFVRDGTRTENGEGPPATGIQAALTVIGRRTLIGVWAPDLANAHIPKAELAHANLRGANLLGADLSDAHLFGANLSDANLNGANLRGANLFDTDLRAANLPGADLHGANLGGTDLRGADLHDANLSGAKLFKANLSLANLSGTNLSDADLFGALLSNADLGGANLSNVNLFGATLKNTRLDKASGTNVELQSGLILKPCGP